MVTLPLTKKRRHLALPLTTKKIPFGVGKDFALEGDMLALRLTKKRRHVCCAEKAT
ncbi:MAG: hypothetical protein LBI10_01440 [Deltaproteobacteria bacterium]|jgi:hypothetical protein|nr:hypothetical protein [Deltaproteobacteria bacterium]